MRGRIHPDCQYTIGKTFEGSVVPDGSGNNAVPDSGNAAQLLYTLCEFMFDEHSERFGEGYYPRAWPALLPNRSQLCVIHDRPFCSHYILSALTRNCLLQNTGRLAFPPGGSTKILSKRQNLSAAGGFCLFIYRDYYPNDVRINVS